MTVLIPEAVEAIGSAAGEAGAGAGETAATKAAPAAAPAKTPAPAAKKAAPAPRAQAALAPRAPAAKKTAAPRPKTGRKIKPFKLPGLAGDGSTAHRIVIAEFILCILLVGTTPILMRKPSNGRLYVPNDFVRITAVSAVFFVLALVSQGKNGARIAAGFGALVTLGVAYNASGSIAAIGAIFTNAQTNKGDVSTAAAGTDTVTMPAYAPIGLTGNPALVGQTLGAGAAAGAQTILGQTGIPKYGTPTQVEQQAAGAAAAGIGAIAGGVETTQGGEQE